MSKLQGIVAVVTGASKGIRAAIAKESDFCNASVVTGIKRRLVLPRGRSGLRDRFVASRLSQVFKVSPTGTPMGSEASSDFV